MGDIMDTLLTKLNSYHILSNLLPGAIFYNIIINIFCSIKIIELSFFVEICVFYSVGMIFNRIGSLVIENICKKRGIIKFVEYKDYHKAANKDNIIYSLNETAAMYRTFLTGFFIILILFLIILILFLLELIFNTTFNINTQIDDLAKQHILIILILLISLIILFFCSYKKQVGYVIKRVHCINEDNKDE